MGQRELRFLDPAMTPVFPIIKKVFERRTSKFKVEFTAGKEWFKHSMFSLHHSGNAVDIRTRTLPDHGIIALSKHIADDLRHALNTSLGKGKYTVLWNDQGPSKPHIHVQYNKGGRWSEPGDFPTSTGTGVA